VTLPNRAALESKHRALRDEFLLRPDVVFLNHGSFGACPRPVFERYQAWQRELELQPVEFVGRRFRDLMAEARAGLAEYVGAAPDDVVYFPNVTVALNVVARSLKFEPGDEVLTTNHEYGALRKTWQFVTERAGARVVEVALPLTSTEALVDAIVAGVTDRTRVVFMSHITSPTALILPVAEVTKAVKARRPDVLVVVDGAHAPSQIDLDMAALGIDFYGANCHKWLSAPKGAGFLYARRDQQHLLDPLVVSWGWPGDFVSVNQFLGTTDPSAYLSVPAAIQFQRERDWPTVRAECHAMIAWLRDELAERFGLPPLAPSAEWHSQLVTIPLPAGTDLESLKGRLYDEHRIEIPLVGWGGNPHVRVSVQGYVTPSDLDTLVKALP
jgi:isopenicillin-N epimerase